MGDTSGRSQISAKSLGICYLGDGEDGLLRSSQRRKRFVKPFRYGWPLLNKTVSLGIGADTKLNF